jgi:hypothetical protein
VCVGQQRQITICSSAQGFIAFSFRVASVSRSLF